MYPERHRQYLEAIGIELWVPRRRDDAPPALPASPGTEPVPAATPRSAQPATPQPGAMPAELSAQWDALRAEVQSCTRCPLHATRTQGVLGVGPRRADWLVIGEAPGAEEDRRGEPFVGAAGQLLTKMIEAMGFARDEVYIANILKCRPPDNRQPTGEEAANCAPYLERQIEVIRPEFLCLLGKTAAAALLEVNPSASMGQLRGKWHRYRGIPTLVTYHPAYLLRTPAAKKDSWEDLQILMRAMGLKIPRRST